MDFISNQATQIQEMLEAIGIATIEELFTAIPDQIKQMRPSLDDGLSELEAFGLMKAISLENTFPTMDSYLGAGAYLHHVPALVSAITSRSEFLTSYTPYQAEASQGFLQAIFEYQSAIAALTGLDASNAGVYDGASAAAESLLMTLRVQKEKRRVLIAESVHPNYRAVMEQYVRELNIEIVDIPYTSQGKIDFSIFRSLLNADTASVCVQSPNFFGIVEEMHDLSEDAHKHQALFIACGNPLAYALFQAPGEFAADISAGDTQPFGLPLHFGGPYAGYISCRKNLIRQLPGRIVGQTKDREGNKGFVLTLQAREQHIRREKATSNICTNQALATLAALVAMLWYGPEGLHRLALTNYQRAHYLSQELSKIPGFTVREPFLMNSPSKSLIL